MNNNNRIRIAVDAMGGDFAPRNEIEGALFALSESKQRNIDLAITLVGDEVKIKDILSVTPNSSDFLQDISIVDAKEVVTMHDDPITALKTKQNSSMVQGIQLLKNNNVEGYISAGNTGASLTIASMLLGRIEGVTRPTIGGFFPTIHIDKPIFIADIGATVESRARFLYEYAVMGSMYCEAVLGKKNPSVGLLNVGEEDSKGTNEHIEAHKHLTDSKINFYGNIEGSDILMGKTDIVVTDGYTGNALLKFAESFFAVSQLNKKSIIQDDLQYKEKPEVHFSLLDHVLNHLNPESHGGVPLLGVKGTVIVGHGNSTAIAIKNMIFTAVFAIQQDVCSKIRIALQK